MPFCPGDLHGQYKSDVNALSFSSSLTLLDDSSSSNRPLQHEMSTFNFWASVSFRSSFFHHLFIPPRPTSPRNFKVRCLIPALSSATVFFHVRTHSTRLIFLAVIKLLETHQYSRPHSCISFLLNVIRQTTICPFVKRLWSLGSKLLSKVP